MKRVLTILLLFSPILVFPQYWEAGFFLGGANYSGDLVDKKKYIMLKETNLAYGIIAKYSLTRRWAFRASLYKGTISGSDANAKKDYQRRWNRNLSFQSSLTDISFHTEFNILPYKSGHFKYKYAPYIFAGVAFLKFNPQAEFNGKWVNLQPLGTEGQGIGKYKDRKYSLSQVTIPFGIGWKQSFKRNLNFGIELSARKTFTDYLDDVSTTYVEAADLVKIHGQISANLSNRTGEAGERKAYTDLDKRGNSDNKDWYFFAGISITYSFLPKICRTF
jgi:hypothetical protein